MFISVQKISQIDRINHNGHVTSTSIDIPHVYHAGNYVNAICEMIFYPYKHVFQTVFSCETTYIQKFSKCRCIMGVDKYVDQMLNNRYPNVDQSFSKLFRQHYSHTFFKKANSH